LSSEDNKLKINNTDIYECASLEDKDFSKLAKILDYANNSIVNGEAKIWISHNKNRRNFFMTNLDFDMKELAKVSKPAFLLLHVCLKESYFHNIIPKSKKEIAELAKITKYKMSIYYKELVKCGFLLNTDFSRKYMIINPDYGFKGNVAQMEKCYEILSTNDRDLIKDFYDNVYKQYIALKELEKKNVRKFDNKKFAVKTAQSVSEQQADSVSYQVEKRQRKAAGGCCPF
jgi:hypothetical protein